MNWNAQPYSHVPLDVGQAVADPVTLHHGEAGRKSGWLQVEITALTPLLAGHTRSPSAENRLAESEEGKRALNQLRQWLGGRHLPADKALLEPLRASWLPGAPVVLPAPSIKGMLRSTIGQLLASPMERVAERHFSHRPNLDRVANGGRLVRKIGVVLQVDRQAEQPDEITRLVIEIRDARDLIFVDNQAVLNGLSYHQTGTAIGPGHLGQVDDNVVGRKEVHRGRAKLQSARVRTGPESAAKKQLETAGTKSARQGPRPYETALGGLDVHRYHMGIDGSGLFAQAWASQMGEPQPTIHPAVLVRPTGKGRIRHEVSATALTQYNATARQVRNKDWGHRKDHPLEGTGLPPLDRGNRGFAVLEAGDVVYIETETTAGQPERVVTFGHHFYYRVAYADTIRQRWVYRSAERSWQSETRPELDLLKIGDQVEGLTVGDSGGQPRGMLSGSRGLFGYANLDEGVNGVLNFGAADLGRLAGRVALNHGLECVQPEGAERVRFLSPEVGCCVALPELATGKGSPSESTLRQDGPAGALRGINWTYGDNWHVDAQGQPQIENRASALAGRRTYLHQGGVNGQPAHYDMLMRQGERRENLENERASLARFVCTAGTQLRFSLEAQDLRDWEWGALLAVLDCGHWLTYCQQWLQSSTPAVAGFTKCQAMLRSYGPDGQAGAIPAMKLGHGRPLGLGSVMLVVHGGEIGGQAFDAFRSTAFKALLERLQQAANGNPAALDERLAAWWRARRYRANDPLLHYADKSYQFEQRANHAKARRNIEPGLLAAANPLADRVDD